MPKVTPRKTAYFNSVDGVSVWWALGYALGGWKVSYFQQSESGRLVAALLRRLSGGRLSFSRVEYQVGDHKGLCFEATRLAVEFTEEWARHADNPQTQGLLDGTGQAWWAEAFVNKVTLLRARELALRFGIVERTEAGGDGDVRFVADGTPTTRRFLQHCRRGGYSTEVRTCPSLPERAETFLGLLRYYFGLGQVMKSRGVVLRRHTIERYLLAKWANWGIGSRRRDDFLVDGKDVLAEDLLLYYHSRSRKPQVQKAVREAVEAGYPTAAWDRVPVSLAWLAGREILTYYLLSPALHTLRALVWGGSVHTARTAHLVLRLRRLTFDWDVFFSRYRVGCLQDMGVIEGQVASTMSVHRNGGIAIKVQMSEVLDESNENMPYLAHHLNFTWGQGVADLWSSRWRAVETVPVGYIWGHLYQASFQERDSVRGRYGVEDGGKLVVAFDNSVGPDCFNSPAIHVRFYQAVEMMSSCLDNARVVVKPKNMLPSWVRDIYIPPVDGKENSAADGISRLRWEKHDEGDTTELIAAADLVVSMGGSSTFIEALVCGVPALILDETGRDWLGAVRHGDGLVFHKAEDLCIAAERILHGGLEPGVWEEVRQRVEYNYGCPDGMALERVRREILQALDCSRMTSSDRTVL